MLAQAEAVAIQKAIEELVKHQPQNDSQYALYLFVIAIIVIGCGAFYVLRYMLGHSRELHETAHKTIAGLSETFSAECKAQREQHHKDMLISRDNVHDMRDVAGNLAQHFGPDGPRVFHDELKKKQAARTPPPAGTA